MVSWEELIKEGFTFVQKLNEKYTDLNNFQAFYIIDPNPGGIGSIIKIKPFNSPEEDGTRIAINNIISLSERIEEDPIQVIKVIIAHECFHHKIGTLHDNPVWKEVSKEFPEFAEICEKIKSLN